MDDGSTLELDVDLDGRVSTYTNCQLDYSVRHWSDVVPSVCLDPLRDDCKWIKSQGDKLDSSFFVTADAAPGCDLEALALAIFRRHVRDTSVYSSSGAEWWVQVRPDTGYADGDERDTATIPFHWDKDETLAALHGVYVSPHLSTVTYLSDHGAPTAIIPLRTGIDGGFAESGGLTSNTMFLSYPRSGKHCCFDGRWLHAAPRCFDFRAKDSACGPRISLLVNVWLGHVPVGISKFRHAAKCSRALCIPSRPFELVPATAALPRLLMVAHAQGDRADSPRLQDVPSAAASSCAADHAVPERRRKSRRLATRAVEAKSLPRAGPDAADHFVLAHGEMLLTVAIPSCVRTQASLALAEAPGPTLACRFDGCSIAIGRGDEALVSIG